MNKRIVTVLERALAAVRTELVEDPESLNLGVVETCIEASLDSIQEKDQDNLDYLRITPKNSTYVLVYQAGIANIFRVSSPNPLPYKDVERARIFQGIFETAEAIFHGIHLGSLGSARLFYGFCNKAGDITKQEWNTTEYQAPFVGSMRPPKAYAKSVLD